MKHVLLIDDNETDSYIAKHIIGKDKTPQKISTQSSAIEALELLAILKKNGEEFPDYISLSLNLYYAYNANASLKEFDYYFGFRTSFK